MNPLKAEADDIADVLHRQIAFVGDADFFVSLFPQLLLLLVQFGFAPFVVLGESFELGSCLGGLSFRAGDAGIVGRILSSRLE